MSKHDCSYRLRRRTFDTIEDLGRRDFLLGAAALAAAVEIETVDINSRLIEAARREGSLMVRYSSPVDEMAEMARPFQEKFGIKVLLDRKVGVLGAQQFAAEERAGQHVMDVNYSSDPAARISRRARFRCSSRIGSRPQ